MTKLNDADRVYYGAQLVSKVYAGATLAWPKASYKDNFNRANASLENSLVASGGWSWTWDGLIANALSINSNVINSNTTSPTGSVYTGPALVSPDHYVQFSIPTGSIGIIGSAAPLVCCRLQDVNNLIGVRVNSAKIDVRRVVAGAATNIVSGVGTIAVGDVIRMEVRGSNFSVYQNGTLLIASTAIGATLTGMRCGFSPRVATGILWDNFECGVL